MDATPNSAPGSYSSIMVHMAGSVINRSISLFHSNCSTQYINYKY